MQQYAVQCSSEQVSVLVVSAAQNMCQVIEHPG